MTRIVDRDEKGRIKKGGAVLTSEEASQMGHKSAAKRKQKEENIEALLTEAGYDDDENQAPAHVVQLATHATKSHAALKDWRRMTNQEAQTGAAVMGDQETLIYRPEKPGEPCQLCGRLDLPLKFAEQLRRLLESKLPEETGEIKTEVDNEELETLVQHGLTPQENPRNELQED